MFNEIKEFCGTHGLFSLYYGNDFIKNPSANNVKEENLQDRTRYVKNFLIGERLSIVEITDVLSSFPVVETKLSIKNISQKNTEIIKDLKTIDYTFEVEKDYITGFPCDNDYAKIVWYRGYARVEEECCPHNDYLGDKKVHTYAPIQARSCDGTMAYFDIVRKNQGVILCVGWTGQWQADFNREEVGVRARVGLQTCEFVLKKGEEYNYVSANMFFYDNGFLNGHNDFRKYMKSVSILGKGKRIKQLPLFTGQWGGMAESKHLKLIDFFGELGTDVYWMDSGWFGHLSLDGAEGGSEWYEHVGNWNINKVAHPSEFAKIKEALKRNNLKSLLWFELERAMDYSDEYIKHPQWFLGRHDGDSSSDQYLLNLGIKEARDYYFEIFKGIVEKIDLDWYRPDFNVDALPYLRNNDGDGRRGITELKYINGLYEFLDRILETYPEMMIDNCAGGGNRMDIEMQKRCITLWRSDYNCYTYYVNEGIQAASIASPLLFPYYGCGVRVSSENMYDIRAAYSPALDINTSDSDFVKLWKDFDKYSNEDVTVEFIKHLKPILIKVINEYKTIRHLFTENFAPHSAYNADLYSWCCYEYYNDDKTESFVQIFRRELSEQKSADYILTGIDERYNYSVKDMDGETVEISGKELLKNGLHVEINNKCESRIFYLKRC